MTSRFQIRIDAFGYLQVKLIDEKLISSNVDVEVTCPLFLHADESLNFGRVPISQISGTFASRSKHRGRNPCVIKWGELPCNHIISRRLFQRSRSGSRSRNRNRRKRSTTSHHEPTLTSSSIDSRRQPISVHHQHDPCAGLPISTFWLEDVDFQNFFCLQTPLLTQTPKTRHTWHRHCWRRHSWLWRI